jgi:hypothetical protein
MIRYSIFIIVIISILTGSCSSRKNKVDKKNIIPEKELVPILTDLFLADGLMSIPRVNRWYIQPDTMAAHKDILEKHGYTKEDMDKTMMYYFIRKPKKLIELYDQALGILSEMETRNDVEVNLLQTKVANLWKGEDSYFIPDSTLTGNGGFETDLINTGIYYLTFTATLSVIDVSLNPHSSVYTCHPDSIETGKRYYIEPVKYFKDGHPHTYKLEINAKDKSHLLLRGLFYDYDSSPNDKGMFMRVEKISLTFYSAVI